MKTNDLRSAWRTWLANRIRIDAWSANAPANIGTEVSGAIYPSNSAMELPLRNVTCSRDAYGVVMSVVLPYGVQWRLAKELRFDQLPLKEVEALYSDLCILALTTYGCISEDIRSVGIDESREPVTVSRMEDSGDWLILLQIGFLIEFEAEVSLLTGWVPGDSPEPPWQITHLDTGIYRSKVGNLNDSTIDRTLNLSGES